MNKNNFNTNDQSDIIAQESGVRSQEYKFAVIDFCEDIFGISSVEFATAGCLASYYYPDLFNKINFTNYNRFFHIENVYYVYMQYKNRDQAYAFYRYGSLRCNSEYSHYGARFQPVLYVSKK